MFTLKAAARESPESAPQPLAGRSEALDSLQLLRGLAAWWVVFHHYMQGIHDFHYTSAIGHFFSVAGKFGVDVFFVISGFIMSWTLTHRRYSGHEFLARRALRIIPAYWFMTFVFMVVIEIFPSPFTSRFDWDAASLALSILFIPHQNPSGLGQFPLLTVGWTLNFEMFFYLWLSAVLWVSRQHWFAACTASMFVLPWVWPGGAPYAPVLTSNLLYEFAIGMLLCRVFLLARDSAPWMGLLPGVMFLLTGAFVFWTDFTHHPLFDFRHTPLLWRLGDVTIHIAAALIVASALCFEQYSFKLPGIRVFTRLGDISYSTYLAHPIALTLIYYFLGRPTSNMSELWSLGAYIALTLLLSYASYRWIETGPAIDILKRALIVPRTGLEVAATRVD